MHVKKKMEDGSPPMKRPIISSSPMFLSPTCPLRSAPITILFSADILSINPSRSSQKLFFSSMLLLTCGAYALTTVYLGWTIYLQLHGYQSVRHPLHLQNTFIQLLPHHYPYPIFSSINSVVKYFASTFNVPCFTPFPSFNLYCAYFIRFVNIILF